MAASLVLAVSLSLGLSLLMSTTGVCANPGKEFLILLPQAAETTFHSQIWVTLDIANGYTNDTKVWLYMQEPDGQQEADLNVTNPAVRFTSLANHTFPAGTVKGRKYLMRLVADGLVTVVVRSGGNSNMDTYLALPVTELGRKYMALTVDLQTSEASNFIVVATGPQPASVSIRLPGTHSNANDVIAFQMDDVIYQNNDVIPIALEPYEAIQLQFLVDVTGALIESSDNVISVLSGANRTKQYNGGSKSHALEQIPTYDMAGKLFAAFPTCVMDNEPVFKYRVVALYHSTTVEVHSGGGGGEEGGDAAAESEGSEESGGEGGEGHVVDAAVEEIIQTKSYLLSSSGNILLLDVGTIDPMTYIRASKPVSVYYISDSQNSGPKVGDVFTLWIPPLDVPMPSAYTFSLFETKDYTFTISFVIEKTKLDGLSLNDVSVQSLDENEFTFTAFDIAGRPDLGAGCIQSSVAHEVVTFHLKHADSGVSLAASVIMKANAEGEGIPLFYGLADYSEENAVQEECCVSVDAQGHSLDPNGCSSFLAPYDTACCVLDYQKTSCVAQSATTSCTLTDHTKLSSHQSADVQADSLLGCHLRCLGTDGCIGANYQPTTTPSTPTSAALCQLLFGDPMGYAQNPSAGSFRQINCVKSVSFSLL